MIWQQIVETRYIASLPRVFTSHEAKNGDKILSLTKSCQYLNS